MLQLSIWFHAYFRHSNTSATNTKRNDHLPYCPYWDLFITNFCDKFSIFHLWLWDHLFITTTYFGIDLQYFVYIEIISLTTTTYFRVISIKAVLRSLKCLKYRALLHSSWKQIGYIIAQYFKIKLRQKVDIWSRDI